MATKDHQHHVPKESDIPKIEQLRKWFALCDSVIRQLCPEGRDRAVALTELETSRMWAIKSLAMQGEEKPLVGFTPADAQDTQLQLGAQDPVVPEDTEHPDFKERRQKQGVHGSNAYAG